MNTQSVFLIFTDLKGYSKLSEQDMIEFQTNICTELAEHIAEFINPEKHVAFNTWGDAVYAVFNNGETAARFAITYRDFFKDKKVGQHKLIPRIAGHFGQANPIKDPLNNGKMNVYGKHVNTAARIEPITRPGEIFVSKAFKNAYDSMPQQASIDIEFDPLGTLVLAKRYGEDEVFRLRRTNEKPHVIDKLVREDLSQDIPRIPEMTTSEQTQLQELRQLGAHAILQQYFDENIDTESCSPMYLLHLAELAKTRGFYQSSLRLLEATAAHPLRVNDEKVHAIPHLLTYKKTKANALTRLGRYQEAQEIMFGLWHSGHQDADTLSMLAAQYKRWAIFGKSALEDIDTIDKNSIDHAMLQRACKLYVEAFRKDISSYYPAINAAYLYLMGNGIDRGKGRKLASYISNAWSQIDTDSWWLAATLAEAEMLNGDCEDALNLFKQAVTTHKPNAFELKSTLEQIQIYSKLSDSEEEVASIIDYLQSQCT